MAEYINYAVLKRLKLRIEVDDPWYPRMKKLKIRGKDLGKLPHELFLIEELEILDLSPEREACLYYRLTDIPSDIGRLINLKVLMVDTNEVVEIPKELALLTGLEKLSLSNNRIKTLPLEFSQLQNLVSLHFTNNEMTEIPLCITELENLEFLDMSDNSIKEVPEDIAKLSNLQSLLLFINKIEHLPDSVCTMVNLRSLWLGQNQLKRLPRNFGDLVNLDWGCRHTQSTVIDGNPLVVPPLEVCKKGLKAIRAYFDRNP